MVEVADQERAPARAHPLAAAEREDPVARERPQVLLGPEHRPPQRVLAERGPVDQVLGDDRRLIVRARDLLDHDAALAIELLGVDLRAPHEVGQQVDRLGRDLRAAGDVEGDEVVRGVGVQDRAHRLRGLVDLAVVVVLLAALEDQVLQEMGHPVLVCALGPGAGVEGHEHRQRARRELDAVEREAVRKGRGVDARHRPLSVLQGTLRAERRHPRTLIADVMAATERHLRRRRHREDPHRAAAPHAPATGAVVSFSNVEKRYSATDVALDGISFDIYPGEFVFLVGQSGSGKSTTMRLLIKESEATGGEIRVAGRDLTKIPRGRVPYYRRNLGVIFQDYKLLPNRTVHDNVAYALQVTGGTRREIRNKVPDILRLTGLSTKLHSYPDQLSGGEQQRVSIARAFVNHPPLLLCDEPTGNLDPETSIDIMRLLYRINQTGTTVLVATHDAAMVDKMRRRVLELANGRIIRDEATGLYQREESTREFAQRMRQPPTRPSGL